MKHYQFDNTALDLYFSSKESLSLLTLWLFFYKHILDLPGKYERQTLLSYIIDSGRGAVRKAEYELTKIKINFSIQYRKLLGTNMASRCICMSSVSITFCQIVHVSLHRPSLSLSTFYLETG